MIRHLPSLFSFVILASAATGTMAQTTDDSWYYGGDIGVTALEVTGRPSQIRVCDAVLCSVVGSPSYGDAAVRLSAVAGYRVAETIRLEGELLFDIATAEAYGRGPFGLGSAVSGNVVTYGLLLNGWFDTKIDASWDLYFGGGAGVLIASTGYDQQNVVGITLDSSGDASDTGTAYQLGLGINRGSMHIGYRYLASGDLGSHGRITAHTLTIGGRL